MKAIEYTKGFDFLQLGDRVVLVNLDDLQCPPMQYDLIEEWNDAVKGKVFKGKLRNCLPPRFTNFRKGMTDKENIGLDTGYGRFKFFIEKQGIRL